jgi:hypothetical protein
VARKRAALCARRETGERSCTATRKLRSPGYHGGQQRSLSGSFFC